MVWLVLAFAVFAAVLAAVCSPLQFRIYYVQEAANVYFSVKIRGLWGLLRYSREIPQKKGTPQADLQKRITITLPKLRQSFEKSRILLANFSQFYHWLRQTMAHLHCTCLRWNTRLGLGEAPYTAVGTGVVWGLKTTLLGNTFKYIRLETKPQLTVIPQFNATEFSTEVESILQIRLGYAILAGFLFLVRILKVKGGIKTWQSVLFKA